VTVYTVGHSTRTAQELLQLLHTTGIRALADVRRFPSSGRHPQFERRALERNLADEGMRYVWLGESLGGRRKEILPLEQSPNRAWKEAGFRHYADAMRTPEFRAGVSELEGLAREVPTVVMCAERDWSRCHRQLIADLLWVRGWRVVHLMDLGKSSEHRLTASARVSDGELSYPSLL
jgi:uncharacterized protein (DUF488 family)